MANHPKFVSALAAAALTWPAAAAAQSPSPAADISYTVRGSATPELAGRRAVLCDYWQGKTQRLDSATIGPDGRFVLQGCVPEPGVYHLRLDTARTMYFVALSAGSEVQASVQPRKQAKQLGPAPAYKVAFNGTPDTDLYEQFQQLRQAYPREAARRLHPGDSFADDRLMAATRRLVRQHPAAPLAAYWTWRELSRFEEQRVFVDSMTAVFARTLPASRYTRALQERQQQVPALMPGMPTPELTWQDLQGQPVALSQLRGQYVVLSYWGACCKPDAALLARLNEQYAGRGLKLVHVSAATNAANWRTVAQAFAVPGLHVSDLQGWAGPSFKRLNISVYPSTVLIDPTGNLVALGLREKALEQKLAELLP
ncbi:AhpC/TSA family protein [Hymenobacter oligotrophus]|uniref:AhpC/TSA family protein n=1 Tax=Hymenobacter oligotrophus TaxID=2319843 RepID=A0A3B7QYP6_9BACT|nr:TlpA disulfide reductase family protein [Hymenobacter oligotrophus]AYA36313.1 AhpC/TSA family protein [Hymenobacter oligotrophus]